MNGLFVDTSKQRGGEQMVTEDRSLLRYSEKKANGQWSNECRCLADTAIQSTWGKARLVVRIFNWKFFWRRSISN